MLVKKIINSDIEKWEQYVNSRDTIAWHRYQWSEVVKKHYSTVFFPLAACEQDQIRGILPLYLTKTGRKRGKLISIPYVVAGGIIADTKAAESALISAAVDLYHELNAEQIIFKQYKYKLDGPLKVDDNFYNRELNLTDPVETIYANLDPTNKYNVEKAKKLNLNLIYPSDDKESFYRMLLKHERCNGVPCVSQIWINDLIEFKMYKIALLKCDGKPVSATLVKEFKDTVSFPFTVTPDHSDKSNMFIYNLYWLLIQKFATEGKTICHSGRLSKNNEMANNYRLGWGGEKKTYYYQYYSNTGGRSEFRTKRGYKRRIVSLLWKNLPPGVTTSLGPRIRKYFP